MSGVKDLTVYLHLDYQRHLVHDHKSKLWGCELSRGALSAEGHRLVVIFGGYITTSCLIGYDMGVHHDPYGGIMMQYATSILYIIELVDTQIYVLSLKTQSLFIEARVDGGKDRI